MTLEDHGIHKTQEDVWEEELVANGWKPIAAHPHSNAWRAPDGTLHPGPGYSWLLMQERKATKV
jgi:hypothetical protein